jgi:hypothetical protein
MHRLEKLWRSLTAWYGLPDRKLTEYILIGAYSSVAIFALVAGLTAKAGSLFGPALKTGNYAGKPEFQALLKKLMLASADFGAGASLLVMAIALVYWNRRTKRSVQEPLESVAETGPPFLF